MSQIKRQFLPHLSAVAAIALSAVAMPCFSAQAAASAATLPPPCCLETENPAVDKFIKEFTGQPESVVFEAAKRQGLVLRISQRDEQYFAGTMDYSPNRVNLRIVKGKVISMSKG